MCHSCFFPQESDEFIIYSCFPPCSFIMNAAVSMYMHKCVCVSGCIWGLLGSNQYRASWLRWIKRRQAPQICHIHFDRRQPVDDSNLSTIILHFAIPILISLQFPLSQSTPQIITHLTLRLPIFVLSICAVIFSCWAVAKSQRDRSVLSWIKQDYWIPTCREGSRKKEGGRGASQE